jgi:hypothetical protein
MGELSKELRNMGYERTEQESPFDEDGELWSIGYEIVCDETGFVIRAGEDAFIDEDKNDNEEKVYRYRHSDKVKLIGGYTGSYSWGTDDDTGTFTYEKER